MIDNFDLVASFIDEKYDGDTFWYTEILDREKRSAGDNRKRLIRMYHHKDRQSLFDLKESIVALCNVTGARAYTRLSPRSAKAVGRFMVQSAVESMCNEQWDTMPYLYARACGRTSIHGRKLWLYDVDNIDYVSANLGHWFETNGWLKATLPSKKGLHYIVLPHDIRNDPETEVSCHKDNPTNLYIP